MASRREENIENRFFSLSCLARMSFNVIMNNDNKMIVWWYFALIINWPSLRSRATRLTATVLNVYTRAQHHRTAAGSVVRIYWSLSLCHLLIDGIAIVDYCTLTLFVSLSLFLSHSLSPSSLYMSQLVTETFIASQIAILFSQILLRASIACNWMVYVTHFCWVYRFNGNFVHTIISVTFNYFIL